MMKLWIYENHKIRFLLWNFKNTSLAASDLDLDSQAPISFLKLFFSPQFITITITITITIIIIIFVIIIVIIFINIIKNFIIIIIIIISYFMKLFIPPCQT